MTETPPAHPSDSRAGEAIDIAQDMRDGFDKLAASTRFSAYTRALWSAARDDSDKIIRTLAALAAPGGEGEPVAGRLEPGDLFWGVCRASHIATNAVAVLRADPGNVGPVLEALERLAKEMDEVVNGDGQVLFTAPPEPVAWRPDRAALLEAMRLQVIELTRKHGNPNGTDYEQGVQDHGNRMMKVISDALTAPSPKEPPE